MNNNDKKLIEQAEYRTKMVEAELNAVRSSKAYKISKSLGIIKAQLKSDPVGLTKKAARMLLQDPKKARHMFRSANRGAFIAQSVVEQNAKYQEWILLNEPDEAELDKQRKQSDEFKYKPVISIVTPVFNPPVEVLEELIESVLEQTYPHFELCLGDFGDSSAVKALLEKYAKIDSRVKYYSFTDNLGIAGNSNQILEKVTGEFIALLDHDDTLSPDALFENVLLLNQKSYDFIYSDKDKIDIDNNRFDPLFKPQISPEMLLNINYLTHLNVMRTSIIKDIGGWDSSTDGAQDWDLFLRVVEKSKYIGHIPKVLYHWRVIASSTALSIETKPYALAGQRKAVDKYLHSQNIPATSYHEKTELFLKWDKKVLDQSPVVFIYYSSLPSTLRVMRHAHRAVERPEFVLLVKEASSVNVKTIQSRTRAKVVSYGNDGLGVEFARCVKELQKRHLKTAIFIKDTIRLPKNNWYENLVGWLAIDKVAAASGRLVDQQDLIVDSGGVITPKGDYFPLFYKYPKYYQSYLGNAEWVRNLSILSSSFYATQLSLLDDFGFDKHVEVDDTFDQYFLWLSKNKYRLVMTPHATASLRGGETGEMAQRPNVIDIDKSGSYIDPFSNPNMCVSDPMRLFGDEILQGVEKRVDEPVERYQHDATILANTFDISEGQILANRRIVDNHGALERVQSVAWFLPSFDAVYAGLMNIFSFANYLVETKHLSTTIYILKDRADATTEQKLVVAKFPGLKNTTFIGIRPEQVSQIKNHDIGIATQWATTYPLAKATNIKRKCYFIQDNETNFYPKGSISSLVELSYRFGFMAIANTEGLLDLYEKKYDGYGVVLKSLVDLSRYYPRPDVHYKTKKPYKVFFYARPNMPRNAFELGLAGLKQLKQELGADVEIITAGAPWSASAYGVEGLFTNLGMIDYDAVPKLYRSIDAGLMFMFSGHPGVTASELMASGCPVVVNEYDDVTWHELYKHEETCLITLPTASEIARNLKKCLTDSELRKKLIEGGLKKTGNFYKGYAESSEAAYSAIKSGNVK